MMMLKYICSKPTGGGPAPLILNPVVQWIKGLIFLHIGLFITASAAFGFPSIGDLSCPELLLNVYYCGVCCAVAFAMIIYFSLLSCQSWGTEREWASASLVTMTMAILDMVTAGWGIVVLVDSSNSMTQQHDSDADQYASCSGWKAYFFYYATAFLITIHVTTALVCALGSFFLAQGVGAQLEEIRRLV
ncbi:putative membrane protein [Besnoitia besnoiti]|uniref:Putative membrane protein n=1 Tax=Besnoitia besnoiti TaxID=94643 RepID=A0A2A9MQ13_BESBE|nr:putative membrane protein [Besnoitia besnoiti]PFH38217.1 putative membrane protein [Besnoitia besnoiti]